MVYALKPEDVERRLQEVGVVQVRNNKFTFTEDFAKLALMLRKNNISTIEQRAKLYLEIWAGFCKKNNIDLKISQTEAPYLIRGISIILPEFERVASEFERKGML